MESDGNWGKSLSVSDNRYKYNIKVALQNTYSMHLYSKLEITKHGVHYFVSRDLSGIDAEIRTSDNFEFTFFATHLTPPSPIAEENSKERNKELLSITKKIKQNSDTCVVLWISTI